MLHPGVTGQRRGLISGEAPIHTLPGPHPPALPLCRLSLSTLPLAPSPSRPSPSFSRPHALTLFQHPTLHPAVFTELSYLTSLSSSLYKENSPLSSNITPLTQTHTAELFSQPQFGLVPLLCHPPTAGPQPLFPGAHARCTTSAVP